MKTLTNLIKGISLLIFTVFILTACQKTELGKEIYLHIGEKQKVTSNLSFSIDSLWDSRCPTKWEYFWAGNVDLFLNITHSHKQIDTLLTCYPGHDVPPFKIVGYNWKVIEVSPYPENSYSDQKDIIIKMIITKD
jgi:hypothetical protein